MESILGISVLVLFAGLLLNVAFTLALAKRLEIYHQEANSGLNEETLEVGAPAPDFEAEALDGSQVTLASYAKKAVALIFMSPNCGPCVEELPSLQALSTQAKAKGVELVLVNVDDSTDNQEFAAEKGITVPLLSAPMSTNTFAQAYKAAGTPFYCLINPEGQVESTGFFSPEWDKLTQAWSA